MTTSNFTPVEFLVTLSNTVYIMKPLEIRPKLYRIYALIAEHVFRCAHVMWWSVEWQSADLLGHYGNHPRLWVADRGTPSSMGQEGSTI